MNAAPHGFVTKACAVSPHQLHLQVVQWVDVGEAVTDRSGQCCVVCQALLVAGDLGQRLGRAVPFGVNRCEHFFAQTRVRHQLAVA